ncbi:phosphotransferase [Halalkalibacter sp. APA_J-10(15)]|uniref:phosphotransferase n=1 Tax=Halalkalibacter sp. APA_J-10(15) TaxID=2933805 RepID=UPI001FF5F302|nr:phosphotransferase [Halalkalibacter sp. APA_J-10(15)]MCK0471055.1 phosphotransferase [Halalkalibacter sp. APA_J-10(15)]
MQLGKRIGEGSNSEVSEWGDGNKVIKLGNENTSKRDFEREYHHHLIAWRIGLPVPQPFKLVEFDNRPGIVFERIYGETLTEHLFKRLMDQHHRRERVFDWHNVRLTARLLSEIHQLTNNDMSPQKEFLIYQINSVNEFEESEKNAVIALLNDLPVKNQVCHGDPNPNNILIHNEKPVLIDWSNAARGNPEVDIAEYVLMIRYAVLPSDTPQVLMNFFDANREIIINEFMKEYSFHTGMTYEEIEPWIVPIAARKLSGDGIIEEEKQLLLKEIRSKLKEIGK